MAEPARISALAGVLRPGRHGNPTAAPGVGLRELRPASIVVISGAPEPETLAAALATRPPRARGATGDGALRLLWSGPDQYFAVSDERPPQKLAASLRRALAGFGCAISDLSHARTVLQLTGPKALDVLAKGCALDLEAMASGECVPTTLGHFAVLLHRRGSEDFELLVMRSFGAACYSWLVHAALEFGLEIEA